MIINTIIVFYLFLVPSVCPKILSVETVNQTNLTVTFKHIIVPYWNGYLEGYRLLYQPVYKLNLSLTRQNNVSEYNSIDLSKKKSVYTINGLQMFTNYSLLLGGRTSKGLGRTCEAFGRTAEGSKSAIHHIKYQTEQECYRILLKISFLYKFSQINNLLKH